MTSARSHNATKRFCATDKRHPFIFRRQCQSVELWHTTIHIYMRIKFFCALNIDYKWYFIYCRWLNFIWYHNNTHAQQQLRATWALLVNLFLLCCKCMYVCVLFYVHFKRGISFFIAASSESNYTHTYIKLYIYLYICIFIYKYICILESSRHPTQLVHYRLHFDLDLHLYCERGAIAACSHACHTFQQA